MRVAALLVSGVMAAGAASAASGPGPSAVQSGSWNEPAVGSVAIPSTTPSGQLQVSYGFNGPLEISAIRFTLPTGTGPSEQVTIKLATAGTMVGTPTVSACPTTTDWKTSDAQAPGYNCGSARQSIGSLTSSDESWTVPASWASKGVVSVALVPSVGSTSPFSISYTAPTASSITIGSPSAPVSNPGGSPATPPATALTPGTVPAAPPATTGAPVVPGAGVGAPVSSPPISVPAPNLGPLPAASNPTSSPSIVAAPASEPAGGQTAHTPQRRGARILAFCLLLATGASLFRAAGRPHRPPRSLLPHRLAAASASAEEAVVARASDSASVVRGIGRFAKVRTAPPTRI